MITMKIPVIRIGQYRYAREINCSYLKNNNYRMIFRIHLDGSYDVSTKQNPEWTHYHGKFENIIGVTLKIEYLSEEEAFLELL
jgi:hypothetical protein